MNRLVAVHPFSAPGALAATEDAAWAFVGEGGALAILRTTASGFAVPAARRPIGTVGVVPVELLVDPDANPDDPAAPNFVYVAGGRDGLWITSADPDYAPAFPSARVDDSGSGNVLVGQRSRRWCCDVGLMTLAGQRYLVALFSRKNKNKLRVYRLSDVRAVLNGSAETGNELDPLWNVGLNDRDPNCGSSQSAHCTQSFGFGLAIHGADAYVALGEQGLMRVRFQYDAAGTITGYTRTWGPRFGTGSAMDLLHPAGAQGDPAAGLYADVEYRGTPGGPVDRIVAPLFTDVAVIDSPAAGPKLFCAVDHLGWVRYDLSGAFDENLLPEHHEGAITTNPAGVKHTKLVASDTDVHGQPAMMRTYARKLSVRRVGDRELLAVAAHRAPLILEPGLRTEGRALGYLGRTLGGLDHDTQDAFTGTWSYTLVYEDPCTITGSYAIHDLVHARLGGARVEIAGTASSIPGSGVPVFAGGVLRQDPILFPVGEPQPQQGGYTTELATLVPPDQIGLRIVREAEDRPGRYAHSIGYSIADPALLMLGSNDAGMAADGFLWTCGNEVRRDYAPPPGEGNDKRGTNGVPEHQEAQWLDDVVPRHFFFWGHGIPPGVSGPDSDHWRLTKYDAGLDLCGPTPTPPSIVKRVWFTGVPDRWLDAGRRYFGAGTADAAYDAATGGEYLFVTQLVSGEGVVLLDRRMIEDALEHPTTVNDGAPLNPISVPPLQQSAVRGRFLTHPELGNVPEAGSGVYPPSDNLVGELGIQSECSTFAPELFQLSPPEGGPPRWFLATPSFTVAADAALMRTKEPNGSWDPDPALDGKRTRALICLFDVTVPPSNDAQVDPTYVLIGPSTQTATQDVEIATYQGRTYLFASLFVGGLLVYDLTDLLSLPPGTVIAGVNDPVATYSPIPCFSDDLPCNVFGVEVDHAVWNESGTVRDELYVYLPVRRVGIEVLRFVPPAGTGTGSFVIADRIQTPGQVGDVQIRSTTSDGTEIRELLVSDFTGGIRVYGYE